MADEHNGKIVVNGADGTKEPFYPMTSAANVVFEDGETLEQKFKKWIPSHAVNADRSGNSDRSDLSEDTRKFMGHPIEDFLLRDELMASTNKIIDTFDWKNSVDKVEDLYTQYPDATIGNIVTVRSGDFGGSIYWFDGANWQILVRNGKSMLPNNIIDKINNSVVINKLEFSAEKWVKNDTDDYQLKLILANADILQVVIYDGTSKKVSTITPEVNENNIVLHSVFPEKGYILYAEKGEAVLNYGDTI